MAVRILTLNNTNITQQMLSSILHEFTSQMLFLQHYTTSLLPQKHTSFFSQEVAMASTLQASPCATCGKGTACSFSLWKASMSQEEPQLAQCCAACTSSHRAKQRQLQHNLDPQVS